MSKSIKRITMILLSVMIVAAYFPAGMAWAASDALIVEETEAAGIPAASASEEAEQNAAGAALRNLH